MRFLGLELSDPLPDANTIWTFCEALTRAQIAGQPAIQVLFGAYETALRQASFLAVGGQIVDATMVAVPKQRNTEAEKADLKADRVPYAWKAQPAKRISATAGQPGRHSRRREAQASCSGVSVLTGDSASGPSPAGPERRHPVRRSHPGVAPWWASR